MTVGIANGNIDVTNSPSMGHWGTCPLTSNYRKSTCLTTPIVRQVLCLFDI